MRKSSSVTLWSSAILAAVIAAFMLTPMMLFTHQANATVSEPCSTQGSPSLLLDKGVYEHGETVNIGGTGYECGVVLTIKVTRPDGTVVKGDGSEAPGSDTITTDTQGTFTYSYQLNGIDGLYLVEVIDAAGVILATTEFSVLSHFRYASLHWAPTGNPGEVVFRLKAAFRRDSIWGPVNTGAIITETQGPTQFNFGDGTVTGTLRFLITSHDVDENWVIGEALNPGTNDIGIRHTYSGAGPFTAYLAGFANVPGGLLGVACCRIGQVGFGTTPPLNNRAGGPYPVQTIARPQSGNSAPVPGLVPIVSVPQSNSATFLVPAADPDVDTLRWRMATNAEAGGCCHPPGMSIDSNTGRVTWNNLTSGSGGTPLNTTNFWTAQVVIEDLDLQGGVKTQGIVDFLLKIVPGNPPNFVPPTLDDGTVIKRNVGETVRVFIKAEDPDVGDSISLNHAGLPSGAEFIITASGNPAEAEFRWTPNEEDAGTINIVCFFATDNHSLSSSPRCFIIQISELSTRKVIFLLGINSEGYLDCNQDPPSLNQFNNLKSSLVGIVSEQDFVWFSYKFGGSESAYCDLGAMRKPIYSQLDTCDGVAKASDELDRLVGKLIERFPNATFDIVGHSMGGLVAAYWATGGADNEDWLSDDPDFLREKIHSIVTLDSPLRGAGLAVLLRAFPLGWVCDSDDPSVKDLMGETVGGDPTVVNAVLNTDAQGSNLLTSRVGFVHVNTFVGSSLPGYWRDEPAPCFGHTCVLNETNQLGAVRRAVRTHLHDDRDDNFAAMPANKWGTDLSKDDDHGWIRGSARKTIESGNSISVSNVEGSIIRLLYATEFSFISQMTAKLRVDGEDKGVLPDPSLLASPRCTRYGFGHTGFTTGSRQLGNRVERLQLCQFSVAVEKGNHIVEVEVTDISGSPFYFDAIEALPSLALRVVVQSPVNILITDPDGRRVGLDPATGTVVNEIPGATYSGPGTEPQIIQIPTMLPGSYELLVTGRGTGDFNIIIETLSEGDFVESSKEIQGTATVGSRELITFDVAAEGLLNLPPTADADGPYEGDEGSPITIDASMSSDPDGDTLTYSFDCTDDGTFEVEDQADSNFECTYSDNGEFTVRVRVRDSGGLTDEATAVVTINNVAPSAALDTSTAIAFPGGDAFLGRKNVGQPYQASATDPGADDLTFFWNFGQVNTYLNPGGVFPFSATDPVTGAFTAPGLFNVTVEVGDDDGGLGSDSLPKLVTDDNTCARSQGFWRQQFSEKGKKQVDEATLLAYLDIVNFASAVFSEEVAASTLEEAREVFRARSDDDEGEDEDRADMRSKATQQALAAWLNFASGPVLWDEPINTDDDEVPDTPLSQVMDQVEAILLNLDATHQELERAKDLAESVNLSDEESEACEADGDDEEDEDEEDEDEDEDKEDNEGRGRADIRKGRDGDD